KTWYQGAPPKSYRHRGYRGSFQFTRRHADVYPDLGSCRMELANPVKPNSVRVSIGTCTPHLETIEAQIDAGGFNPVPLAFDWYLHEGENSLRVRSRNQFGVLGKTTELQAALVKKGS